MVIVVAAEGEDRQGVGIERRRIAKNPPRRFQFFRWEIGCVGDAGNHAYQLAITKGHQHATADVVAVRVRREVIEVPVHGHIENHLRNPHPCTPMGQATGQAMGAARRSLSTIVKVNSLNRAQMLWYSNTFKVDHKTCG